MKRKCNGAYASLTIESENDDLIASELDLEGHKVVAELNLSGETYHYPERRVDGNPTLIADEEENGVHIKSVKIEELTIDDVAQTEEVMNEYQTKYQNALLGLAEDYDERGDIEWEYEEDYYD